MLPIIDHRPITEIKLPESKRRISIKPYKTSQEKIILQSIADETDRKDWFLNMKQIIADNVNEEIDFNEMSMIDFVYICMKLRTISKGQTIDYGFECDGEIIDDEGQHLKCGFQFKESDSIDDLIIIKNSEVTKKMVDVNKNLSIELSVPKLKYMEFLCDLNRNDVQMIDAQSADVSIFKYNIDLFSNLLAHSVTKVIVKDKDGKTKTYTEFTAEEMKENVILNLTVDELEKLFEAKSDMIAIVLKVTKQCKKCGKIFDKEDPNFFAFIA